MSYYFLYQRKGIPTWLAYFLILVLTVGLTFTLKSRSTKIISRASKNLVPKELIVSNLSNQSASVHFFTDNALQSYLTYSSAEGPEKILFDSRDTNSPLERKLHYFTLNQLQPDTVYQLRIYLNSQLYKDSYDFKTLNIQYPQYSNTPIFGKLLQPDFKPAAQALVNVTLKSSRSSFTALSGDTGEWIVTLPIVLSDNREQVEITPEELLTLKIADGKLTQASVLVKYKDAQPLRSIIVGDNYDFTGENVLGISQKKSGKLILSPEDNAVLTSSYPVFRGKGEPNTLLKISIMPDVLSLLVTVDKTGDWKFTPFNSLSAGKYRLVVKNDRQEEELTFHIGKSGETVLGEATPSGTLTTAPTSPPTQVPTQKLTTTPQPTSTIIPLSPTVTQNEIPELGINTNLLILFASGLSLLGLYLVMY